MSEIDEGVLEYEDSRIDESGAFDPDDDDPWFDWEPWFAPATTALTASFGELARMT